MLAVRILVALAGIWLVLGVVMSAMRTVVLPRGAPVRLTGAVFFSTRRVFDVLLRFRRSYESADRLMALYAPITLLLLPFVWLSLTWLGFGAMMWAVEQDGIQTALITSGSSLVTLGFDRPEHLGAILLTFAEGALAISVLALLLVTYLPSMYSAFSEREQQVALFEVRAGTPPTATDMMIRYHHIRGLATTELIWVDWEQWFAKVSESHTSLPALVFFRSPDPRLSWITAAGAVLDAAAMMAGVIDLEQVMGDGHEVRVVAEQEIRMPTAETCLRAGYLALRTIANQFSLPHDPDPAPGDPISVTREEFDTAYEEMAAAGVPLRTDRDAAWRAFAGWRVNYDSVLLQLATLTVAPATPWVSDRDPVGPTAPMSRHRRTSAARWPDHQAG